MSVSGEKMLEIRLRPRRATAWLTALALAGLMAGCDDDQTTDPPAADGGAEPEVSVTFSSPSPAQGATEIAPEGTTLSWEAEPAGTNYQVFLSTDYAAVAINSDDALLGDTAETELDAGMLVKGAAYFWRVEATYEDELYYSPVWSFSTPAGEGPGAPTEPDPASGDDDVELDATLSWQASDGAEAYRVYFGDDPADVSTDSGDALIGEQAETTIAAPDLELAGRYYWRVVAVNADGQTSSPLWSFDTVGEPPAPNAPTPPTDPAPPTGAEDVPLDTDLRWGASEGADGYRVFFGDDLGAVSAGGGTLLTETAETQVAAPDLMANTAYFWRVEAYNDAGTTRGDVWGFATAAPPAVGAPSEPMPMNRAEGVAIDTTLGWTGGEGAVDHRVYLSMDPAEVVAQSADALVGDGESPLELDAPLMDGASYYWMVVAVSPTGETSSPLWRFETALPERPAAVTDPSPANLADEVAIDPTLSWGGGEGAMMYDVYFGQDPMAVQVAQPGDEGYVGTIEAQEWAVPDALGYSETWYWRVDARNVAGVTRGTLWAFTTDSRTRAPEFRGVSRALALGGMLRVDWDAGFDDDDDAEALTYRVYAWPADGPADWEDPIAEVVGETSVMVGRDVLGPRLDGPLTVAVRGWDAEGESVLNTVQLTVPPTAGLPRFYVAEGGEGGGGPDAPFGDLGAALTAAAEAGGVVLVGGGRYLVDGYQMPAGDAPVVVVGGFDWQAVRPGAPDGALLGGWDPAGVGSTLYRDEVLAQVDGEGNPIAQVQTSMIEISSARWLMFAGLRFEDPNNQTVWLAGGGSLVATGNWFTQLDPVASDEFGNDQRVFESGSIFTTPFGAGRTDAWLVGNTLDDTESLLSIGDQMGTIRVSNNRMRDVWDEVLLDITDDLVDEEGNNAGSVNRPWLIPAGGTLLIHFEANDGHRIEGFVEGDVAAADPANGGDVSLVLRGNTARNVDNEVFEFDDLCATGAGGAVNIDIRENRILGSGGETFGVDLAPADDALGYRLDCEASVTLVAEDNEILHTNDDAFTIGAANPPADGFIEATFRRNQMTHLESEGIEFDTAVADERGPLSNGRITLIVEDNYSEGVDGSIDASFNALAGGQVDLQFRRNVWFNDHDYGHRIVFNQFSGPAELIPADATTSWSMVIEDTDYAGEDQLLDFDGEVVAGDTYVAVERNHVVGSQQGVDVDYQTPEEATWPTDGGTMQWIFRDNTFFSETDGLELRIYSRQDVAELYVERNYALSSHDYGVEIDAYDMTRVVVANNVFVAPDDDAMNIDVRYMRGVAVETDVILFHNDARQADDENLYLSMGDQNEGNDLGSMNMYVAGNSMYGNTESEAMEFDLIGNVSALIERNQAGYNDVDSSDALYIRCGNEPGRPFIRARNNIMAQGAGDGIDADTCGGTYHNNTIVYNNRDNTSSYGVNSDDDDCPDNTFCYDQSLFHSNVLAVNAYRDLPDDEGFQVPYSIISENPYAIEPGPGVIVGDPLLTRCDDNIDPVECFSLDRRSPAIDAGHPGELWNDRDGTRNDMGAYGGPWSGWIAYQGDARELPVALIAARPFGDLTTGRPLVPVDSTITLVFSVDIDAETAEALEVRGADGPVDGAWAIARNRAVFTPAAPFEAGQTYTAYMGAALQGAAGEVTWGADWIDFTTATASIAEVEGDPQPLAGAPVFSVDGSLEIEVDAIDTYTIEVQAGDRVQLSVFSERLLVADASPPHDVGLRLRDAAGVELDAAFDVFYGQAGFNDTQDPYIEYVAMEDATLTIEVFVEEAIADPVTAMSYRLDGVVRPL